MNIYILQENYSYTNHEAGWDENGVYSEEVERHNVIGVFTSLEDAVKKLVETCSFAKECDLSGDEYWDYDILVGNMETTQVHTMPSREYQELLVSISCMKQSLSKRIESSL